MPQHLKFDSAEPPRFFACIGADIVEHADQLPVLLSLMCATWESGFGADVAIWEYPGRLLEVWTADGRKLALRRPLPVA
jgi:hypothetical protein